MCYGNPDRLFKKSVAETSFVPYQVLGVKPQESSHVDIRVNEDESIERMLDVQMLRDEYTYTLNLLRQAGDFVNAISKHQPIEWVPDNTYKCPAKVFLLK